MGLSHSPRIVTSGLVGYWDAGNPKSYPGSGNTWYAIVGSNNATLANGTSYNSSNGGYFSFLGSSSQYVDLGSNFSSILNSSLPITFETIVYLNLSSNTESIISNNGTTFNDGGFALRKMSTNIINSTFVTNGSNYIGWSSNVLSSAGWYHTVSTYNGAGSSTQSNYNLYINSVLSNITTFGGGTVSSFPSNKNFDLGRTGNGAGLLTNYLTGNIASVRIYNRALSAAEVSQNFNALRGRFGI